MQIPTSRRSFLKSVGAVSLTSMIPACSKKYSLADLRQDRKQAAHRKRRVIMNNDGNEPVLIKADEPFTAETMLQKRSYGLPGTHVDSIFYCTGVFNYYYHPSNESEWFLREGRNDITHRFLKHLNENGTDPLKIMIQYCQENHFEIFWSMRMNDTHDSGSSVPLCEWKKAHPDYMVGTKDVTLPYGANRWSSVDYGLQPVRDKVLRILQDVCTRYDVDGIELDFFRHPVLFKPQMTGEPVTQEHCDLMTGLMKRIRTMTEEIGLKRGRPFLIGIRVPDSVDYCKALGIDLEQWLADDLVDLIVGGGYFKLEPWENWAALGKKYDVPAYACFVKRRIQSSGEPEGVTEEKIWRGEALNAWKAGVDGIYTFNRFNPKDQIFRELGDPELLKTLERTDRTAYVNPESWSRPERWLKDGDKYVKEPKS